MLQDSSLTTRAHICTLFRITVVGVNWNRTNILFTHINCTKIDVKILQYENLCAILRQRPKRNSSQSIKHTVRVMLCVLGCDSCLCPLELN